jgi:beta-lactamase class A
VKQTPAARRRRHRLLGTIAGASVLAVGVVLVIQLPARSHDHRTPPSTLATNSTAAPTATASLPDSIRAYLARRDGAVSVAVYDAVADQLTLIHPDLRGRTASIVKVDILETLLHRTGGHLSHSQRETATAMIEHSDNDAATELWNEDGEGEGVTAYNDDLGLQHTVTNLHWGLTKTTAADQVTLVKELVHHSPLLTNSSRHFQRHLMHNVEADQRWGITGGVPSSAKVAIKNGWLPVEKDDYRWAVNSIGWVRGDGKNYEIAVLTQRDSSEHYGIHTIEHVAGLVWDHMTVDH